MGFLMPDFNRQGPGVSKTEARKTGAARWFEVMWRDKWDFTKANFLLFVCMIPSLTVVCTSMLALGEDMNLLTLLVGVLGGALLAFPVVPAMCGMQSVFLRSFRDEPGYFWVNWKKAFKENFKKGAVLGMVYFCVLLLQAFTLLMYVHVGNESVATVAIMALNVLVCTMVMTFALPQMVALELGMKGILLNSVRLALGYMPRTLPAALVALVCIVGQVLLVPVSVVPMAIIGLWIPLSISAYLVYAPMNKVFKLEEQYKARYEQEMQEKGL